MQCRVHLVAAPLLLAWALNCHAEALRGCAPAVGPKDHRARQTAILNAITADLRARNSPETAGAARVLNESVRLEVSSVVSAKLKNATVVREEFHRDSNGNNPRLCVDVMVLDPQAAKQ